MSIQNLFSDNDYSLYCNSIQIGAGGTALDYYDEDTITIVLTGVFTNPQSAQIKFTRIGNIVHAIFPSVVAASTVAGQISGTIPAGAFRPGRTVSQIIALVNNAGDSNVFDGFVEVNSGGLIEISRANANWGGTGNCGFAQFVITYPVD